MVKGQEVEIGEVIGKEGETGWATGPHVHLQINVWGIPVNPRIFLGDGDPEDIVITQSFSQPAGFINDDLVYFGHKT